MYLYLGQDTVIKTERILGIFDLDNTTISKTTKDFLNKAQKEDRVIAVSRELPKSFVVYNDGEREVVYLSQISPSTLRKRAFYKNTSNFNF